MSFLDKWRRSEHRWVEESLSCYMDGELSAAEKARVESHLHDCQACAYNLNTLQQTVALLKELPTVPAPRSFAVRPAAVTRKPAIAPPSWGFGLLRGATALAALLLVLLVGGDLALHFVVGGPLVSWAPAAPAPPPAAEVALVPSFEPGVTPGPLEEQQLSGRSKATEASPAPTLPTNVEDVPAPAPAPTEAAEFLDVPEDTGGPAASVEGEQPDGTPPAVGTPGEPVGEYHAIGAGEGEPTAAAETPPTTPPKPDGAETADVATHAPSEPATPDEEESRATAPAAATPDVVAMEVEEPGREADELAATQAPSEALPLSPLRLAELIVFGLLILLVSATVVSAWLRRRAD